MAVCGRAVAPTKASKVFFLENSETDQWCAFNNEARWNATVQHTSAMTVGTLSFANDNLSQIDVTETDQSGDWTVYDRYFLDDRGGIVKLSRIINVVSGDWSVLQTFSISDAKATKIGTTLKELSTGKLVTSTKPDWLPELPIETTTERFPFSKLLAHRGLRTSSTICVEASGRK